MNFLALTALVMVMSHVLHMFGVSVTYDALNLQTHTLEPTTVAVRSLLTGDGIRFVLTSMIRNFMTFGPVGIILVAMIGVGLAEEAGLMKARPDEVRVDRKVYKNLLGPRTP